MEKKIKSVNFFFLFEGICLYNNIRKTSILFYVKHCVNQGQI